MVNRMSIAMAGSGGAVALGLVLMALGTQAVLEDVVQASGTISAATPPLEVEVVMEEEEGQGVFAVQVLDAQEGSIISAVMYDPHGSVVGSVQDVSSEPNGSTESKFTAEIKGTYSLVIHNEGQDGVLVFGAAGPLPDNTSKALAFLPFYVLLAGIMGMAGIAVYWAVGARRQKFS